MKVKNSVNPRKLILDTLKKHPEGLTLTNIAKICGMHRHTVTKYIYELRGANLIYERDIGPAKLCYIKEDLTKKEENKTMKRLSNDKKSKLGQVQILAILLFLFMVPTGIIIAQNATESFQKNLSLSLEGNLIAAHNNTTDVIVENTPLEYIVFENTSENSTDILQNFNVNQTLNENLNENISENITLPESSLNETNETQVELPILNETSNETLNETNETIVIPEIYPKLEVSIKYPENIIRGELINLEARAFNSGTVVAKNVILEWHLPEGFDIVSGNQTENCGDLFEQSICFSNITISTSYSVPIGPNDIKVEVRYR